MKNFVFDLQRFVSIILAEGETYELDGINYTAGGDGAQLNLDAQGKISSVSNGQVLMTLATEETAVTLPIAGNYIINQIAVTTTANNLPITLVNNDAIKTSDGMTYQALDGNVHLTLSNAESSVSGGKVNLNFDAFDGVFGADLTEGGISYSNGKFTVSEGAKTYNFPTELVAQNDFSIQMTKRDDGLYSFTIPDGAADFSIVNNGVTMMESRLSLNGEIFSNPATHEIFLTKGTTFTLGKDGKILEVTALDDAGGQMTFTESGIRFAPHENDGALEFNFLLPGRKATLDVTGAFTYGGLGRMSLENGTEATFTWEDGNQLKLNSRGSTGSISLDFNKGIGITSSDENLDLSFISAASGYTTTVSGIQGTIWYNAGKITIDENTKLTGSGSFGGQSVNVTLEAIDGDGFLRFGSSGVNYGAGTGKLKITLSKDDLTSTFTVNKGEVLIGHNIFNIAVGSDIATDLQSFIPALSFVTTEPGEYTVNGQTITTSAENLALTATDNQMIFRTSSDAIAYDGMNFAGDGNVTLSPASVTLGNGVVATGFGEENTFILTEQGTVTADEKVFELTEDVPTGISVKGAEDGFIFSRTLTKESEERLGYYDSPDVGKIFNEEFHSAGDDSYRIETDLIGLEKVSGISDGATITGGATLADEKTLSYYVLGTDTNGKFTIGEKTYTLNERNQVGTEIRARFDEGGTAYADRISNLNGIVSGDFTAGPFKINGGSSMQVVGDNNVSIYANENGYEIYGLEDGASLKVLDAGTYVVNSTTIESGGTNFIVGNPDGTARLLYENYFENGNTGNSITGTEGNDVIYNIGANTQIYALGGNDTITNANASNSYIDAGDGDNVITENLNYEIANINGQDTLLNYYENDTIVSGSGNDYIYNRGGYYLSVASGAGNDTVRNIHGYYPTISTGAGDDSVVVEQGHYQYVDAGDGNDSIIGSFESGDWAMGGHATLVGGNGNDYIDATDTNDASVLGGQGNDTILVSAITASENSMYLDGGEGDDYIQNANDSSQIYAGEGNNSVDSYGSNVTITSGAGNDTITNQVASNVVINAGDGDNVITEILDYEVANVEGKDTLINYYENSTITAGSGNDSVYNEGGYYLNLETGAGNDTVTNIHGYYPTISTGAGDDSVVIGKGHYQNISTGDGNDVIIGSVVGGGWAMGGHATIDAGAGEDYIDTGYTNDSSIFGGEGNDTIITTGENSTIDAGAGENIVSLSGSSEMIIFSGKTTVEGFTPGFGDGADGLYIMQSPPGVDFSESGLTFLSSTDTVTFSDIHHTAKIDLYHTQNPQVTLASAVVLAENEWYTVTDDDLAIRNDYKQGLYFVGGTTTANHGVDFSNIAQDVNVTLDTEYELDDHHLWINNVGSIKGGAGFTSITGSSNNDTIISGGGPSSLWGGKGNDYLAGGESGDTFIYALGDGNDVIQNAGEGDLIFLSNISMEQILSANIAENSVALSLSDGGTINISGTGEIYQLANGSRYSADHENFEWHAV